jgi:topoisomerase-4 subunit A
MMVCGGRVRAKIAQLDKNTLVIPKSSTNTMTLIDSILKANEKVKSKSRK